MTDAIDFWDREYQAGRSLHRWPDESLVSFAVRTLKADPQVRTILDAGCGSGRHVTMLAALGFTVTGLEPSATAREFARKLLAEQGLSERTRILDGDVRDMPLADASVDVVLAWHLWNNLAGADDLARALAEFRRVLRPGGRLVCTMTSPDDCNFPLSRATDDPGLREIVRGANSGLLMRFWTEEQARKLLEQGGFQPERLGSYSRTVNFDPDQRIAGWLVSATRT